MLGMALSAVTLAAREETAPPFTFDKPAFMSGPQVSNSLMGSTYAYTARASGKATHLLITIMRIGYYYVVHFVDELRAATRSFPAIRTSLKTLAPRRN